HVGREVVIVDAQRSHVLDRLTIQSIEILVGGCQRGRSLLPTALQHVEPGFLIVRAAAQRFARTGVADENVVTARVPPLPRFNADLKTNPAIGVRCSAGTLVQTVNEAALEIAIRVGSLKLSAGLVPLGRYATTAHEPASFDFKDIREIRAECDLEVEADR